MSTKSFFHYWLHRLQAYVYLRPHKLDGGTFYKYRSFGDGLSDADRQLLQQRLKDMVVNQEVYFAKPSQFNDPFDCHPRISIGYSARRFKKWIDKLVEENPNSRGETPAFKKRLKENIARIQRDSEFRNESFRQILDSDTAIFSMSKTYKSLLQWAYYADSHQGLCLEYTIDGDFCESQLYQVAYVRFRHIVDIIEADYNARYRAREVLRAAATKSESWSHEREVRAIRVGSGVFNCPKTTLTGVGFGLKATPANKAMVQKWIQQAGLSIQLFEMKNNSEDFGLHREII